MSVFSVPDDRGGERRGTDELVFNQRVVHLHAFLDALAPVVLIMIEVDVVPGVFLQRHLLGQLGPTFFIVVSLLFEPRSVLLAEEP